PISSLFPYTTLFRSKFWIIPRISAAAWADRHRRAREGANLRVLSAKLGLALVAQAQRNCGVLDSLCCLAPTRCSLARHHRPRCRHFTIGRGHHLLELFG